MAYQPISQDRLVFQTQGMGFERVAGSILALMGLAIGIGWTCSYERYLKDSAFMFYMIQTYTVSTILFVFGCYNVFCSSGRSVDRSRRCLIEWFRCPLWLRENRRDISAYDRVCIQSREVLHSRGGGAYPVYSVHLSGPAPLNTILVCDYILEQKDAQEIADKLGQFLTLAVAKGT